MTLTAFLSVLTHTPHAATVISGTVAWQSRSGLDCVWLPRGQVAIELLLQDGSEGDQLLLVDGQHAFVLLQQGQSLQTVSLESIGESSARPARLPTLDADGEISLDFNRNGDACGVTVLVPRTTETLTGEQGRQAEARLRNVARVVRRMTDGVRALRGEMNPKAALQPAQEALQWSVELLGPEDPLTAVASGQFASVLWNLGRNEEALQSAERAVAIFEGRYGADAAVTLDARKNRALFAWEVGNLERARKEFEDLRPLVIERFGTRSNVSLALLSNLATLYHELGEMRAAVDMLSTTYLLREERDGVNDRKTLLVLNNLAHALRTAGRSEEALKLFEESYSRYRKALGDRDVDTLRAQHNLGSELCFDALHPDCGLLREAARVKAEVLGPTHPETLFSRSNLGVALLNQGQAAEALPELEAVYQGRLAAMTARHWWVVASKGVLSSALALTGKREEGLAGLRESNDELERLLGPTHERTLTGLWGLARTCGRLGDLDCQRQALIDMVNRAESVRGVEALRGEAQSRAIRQLTPGYRQLARIQAADGQIDAAIETIERSKARGLLAAIGLRSAETHRGLPKESLQKLADLDRRIAVLADERQRTAEPARVAELELQQSRLADEAARVREELRRTFPRYGAASRIAVPSVKLLASALAADELFLGYAALDDGFLAYTVSSRGVRNVWFLPTPQVRSMVESWRGTLTQQDLLPLWRRPDGSYLASPLSPGEGARAVSSAQLGSELASRLIGPLQAQLGAYRRWIVSPDGVLATLPFETLPWKGSLVASTVEVRYAQSLSVYRLLRNRPAEQTLGLMAMGGPTYARGNTDNSFASIEQRFQLRSGRASDGRLDSSVDRAGLQWQPLPGAAREARDVAALFSASRVFVGDDASEDRLQALNASGELQHFRYLLFATHGVLSVEVPSQSAIVLRQPGSAAADGYVTAAEFSGYSFRSELIVLSACETGLGREVAGEGVMGLPYALFIAGNRNTLLSLWKVPDDSTAHFMQRFFTRLRAGVPQATALAQTRREMAASTRYRNPIHWAGFVLYGA